MTILIVEDNPTVRRLIRRATSDIADKIWECEDGADALAAYTADRPDVVLMDVRMPRMDGLSATREILRHHPDARIIILTDYNDDELRSAAREAGACAYALKHNLTELDTVLQEVLGQPPCASSPRIN
ncbi:response regulator transcription factor [Acidobacterium sp. S8]|uniref:response regulator transcription factor n=1 Tax=Acidobacterium sp. S8 TaxID=1641854 RepID=UPI00131EAA92|nr:response regulator transcription factor [Acidobacterium sp. S8]